MKVQEGERGSLRALEWERAGGLALSELALGCFFFGGGGGGRGGGGGVVRGGARGMYVCMYCKLYNNVQASVQACKCPGVYNTAYVQGTGGTRQEENNFWVAR